MDKVRKVMKEFKEGELHSGSKKGPLVKNRKQAVAIALSEAGKANPMKNKMNSMMAKEGRGMAKADLQKTGMKGYAGGGMPMVMKGGKQVPAFAADGVGKMNKGGISLAKHASMPASKAHKGLKAGGMAKMKKDEMPSKMGGVKSSSNPDGVITKGRTKGKVVKMAAGGESKAMVKKEVGFMKKKGAPKSMIKHEMEEVKKMRYGGKC